MEKKLQLNLLGGNFFKRNLINEEGPHEKGEPDKISKINKQGDAYLALETTCTFLLGDH